jgi:hypothetical protein
MTLNDNFTKQEKMLLKEKDNSAKEPSEDIAILPKDKMPQFIATICPCAKCYCVYDLNQYF